MFLGGIFVGEEDVHNGNAIKHRTARGAPRINVVPFGYQRINEHFFYYKSLMNLQYWDNMLIDAQYELGMNRAFLDTSMPLAVTGSDKVDSEIIYPNSVVAFEDKDVTVSPLLPQADLGKMFGAMHETERSMDEASVSATTGGQEGDPNVKATAIAIAARQAQINLLGVGKTMAESVVQMGNLISDIAVNHLSVPEVQEIVGGGTKIKYNSFILNEKVVNGKEFSKVLRFDADMLGAEMTEAEEERENLRLLEEVGFPNNDKHIINANPALFAAMKYLTRVEPARMFAKNEEFQQAIMSQIYAQFREDPLIDAAALVRKTLYAFFRGETEALMAKQNPNQALDVLGASPPQTVAGQQAVNGATGRGLTTAGMGGGSPVPS